VADDETFRYQRLALPDAEQVPQNWIPMIDDCGILLRSRHWSNMISDMRFPDHAPFRGDMYLSRLLEGQRAWRNAVGNIGDSYLILAVDGETFGHHHKNAFADFLVPFFEEAQKRTAECRIVSLNDIFFSFKKIDMPREFLPEGSWSTSHEDMQNGIPYPLWAHPHNPFHVAWNKFFQHAFAYCGVHADDLQLQELMDSAFYSCSPWWATRDNPNDRKIAGWCLPMFKRIMELASQEVRQELVESYRAMQNFIEQNG
ncbi:hypothetical protein KGQ34_02845, partial [Patescibacteria group bacterium]|nr:hypothetical protein [Patescibacteria group bacterium]